MTPFQLTPAQEACLRRLETTTDKQTRGMLDNGMGEYCCLGEFCLEAEAQGVPVNRTQQNHLTGGFLDAQPEVLKWLGLRSAKGCPTPGWGKRSLIYLNDTDKLTFPQIAAILRNAPELYFIRPGDQ